MPTNNNIGSKIKHLREMRDVTIEELSERCGMSVEQIQQIESGAATASLTPLLRLARGLGVRLGTFLDDSELSGPVVTRAQGSAANVVRFKGRNDFKGLEFHALAANKSDRNMEPFIIDVNPPETEGYDLSSHEGEEFIYVMSGVIEVAYGKKKYELQAGDSIYYDSIVMHHLHAKGPSAARILAVIYAPH